MGVGGQDFVAESAVDEGPDLVRSYIMVDSDGVGPFRSGGASLDEVVK